MFYFPSSDEDCVYWNLCRPDRVRMVDMRLVRLLQIPKWDNMTGVYLGELCLKVDHELVRSVLEGDYTLDVKINFFQWTAANTRMFLHGSTSYMALIRCLDEAQQYCEIHRTIQDVLKNPYAIFGKAELSELMKVLGRAKMVNEALLVLYKEKHRNIKPDSSTYNSVILMLMEEGMYEKVLEIYAYMKEDCFADTATYSALISTYEKLSRYVSAVRMFDEMKDKCLQPTEEIYVTLLGIYFRVGKVKNALKLFEEMKQGGCSPTVYTYTELIKGLGNAGKVEEAYVLYKDMLRDGLFPDDVCLITLMNMLCKVGLMDELTYVINEMKMRDSTQSVVPYDTVIKALFESKAPVPKSSSLFYKMVIGKQIEWTEICGSRWMKKSFHKRS